MPNGISRNPLPTTPNAPQTSPTNPSVFPRPRRTLERELKQSRTAEEIRSTGIDTSILPSAFWRGTRAIRESSRVSEDALGETFFDDPRRVNYPTEIGIRAGARKPGWSEAPVQGTRLHEYAHAFYSLSLTKAQRDLFRKSLVEDLGQFMISERAKKEIAESPKDEHKWASEQFSRLIGLIHDNPNIFQTLPPNLKNFLMNHVIYEWSALK